LTAIFIVIVMGSEVLLLAKTTTVNRIGNIVQLHFISGLSFIKQL